MLKENSEDVERRIAKKKTEGVVSMNMGEG